VLLLAVVAYAVFGGADFGAGFWDLTAGGPQRGARPRAVIEHSIGPVWEANHVWLIFIFVILWTSFPAAYASITLTLFVPLMVAALGIVLRGASFAFRKAVVASRNRRLFGAAFALSSVLVPYCMGAIVGGIASGRVPAGGQAGDPVESWINPTSVVGGVLAVAAVAYLSAVYLVWDARRLDETEMAEYFRRRAVASTIVVAVIAALVPIDALAEMVSIGTLFAFVVVAIAVAVLRRTEPKMERPFKTPQVPLLPIITAVACVGLMANLAVETWLRFLVWLLVGMVIYFGYGRTHSRLSPRSSADGDRQDEPVA